MKLDEFVTKLRESNPDAFKNVQEKHIRAIVRAVFDGIGAHVDQAVDNVVIPGFGRFIFKSMGPGKDGKPVRRVVFRRIEARRSATAAAAGGAGERKAARGARKQGARAARGASGDE